MNPGKDFLESKAKLLWSLDGRKGKGRMKGQPELTVSGTIRVHEGLLGPELKIELSSGVKVAVEKVVPLF